MYYQWGISLTSMAFTGYLISGLLYLVVTWVKRDFIGKLAYWTAVISFGIHTTAITMRTVAAGRLPFTTMHEFVVLFAWGIVLVYLFVQVRYQVPLLGLLVIPMAMLLLAYASALSHEIRPLMPALQSNWLQIHVFTAVLAYGAFGVSFGASVLYLLQDKINASVPNHLQDKLDYILYKSISFGFLLMTLVITTGAVWAEQAWGRWWSWDPKETWALVTWIIYALYLHARLVKGWQGKRSAWMAVGGFIAVLFTLFGVTVLMSGLHSYG